MKHPAQILGILLKKLRIEKRQTLQTTALAAKAPVDKISALELGTISLPNNKTLGEILNAYGTSPEKMAGPINAARKSGPIDPKEAFPKAKSMPAFLRLTKQQAEDFYETLTAKPSWG